MVTLLVFGGTVNTGLWGESTSGMEEMLSPGIQPGRLNAICAR